ncbi:Rne/Rng family ribonuclease [Streptomyces sp. MOE7]|uniref:Rne/Rng family ribonuclease n=1 Tax=Streptomyces sp. MOE7 TaxID=1961713 RepID=UPI000A07FBDD|nr:Rne/Rng family ribonuclease [Streptomyces sp. MOE7]ARH91209.1 ribonuclease E/G [Streptomyces sp. MOE7]
MLEPIEPTDSTPSKDRGIDDNHSPSDTLPPRRRRRAASRPAGPPVAGEAPEAAVVSTETAAAPADDPAPAGEPAAASVTTGDDAKPARARRRATRKATSPAGPPQPAAEEPAEAPAAVEAPAAAAEAPAEAPQAEDAAPRRTRRRATRKVSAPAGSPQTETAVEPAAEAPAPAAVTAEAAPVAEEAKPARARRRATRKATAPAGAPQVSAAEETAPEAVESAAPAAPAAEEEAPAPAEEARPARARRRATRKATAPAGAPEAAEEAPAAEAVAASEPAEPAEAPRRRSRRRAAEPTAEAPRAEEPRAEEEPPQEAPARGRRRAQRPPTAVFQAPVFTEPMFQTPESAAAAHAAARQEEATTEAVEEQPAASRRRRRRGAPAEPEQVTPVVEPETGQAAPAAVEEAEPETEPEESGQAEDESAERPSRRRRRGGRRRRRGESADGADEQSAEDAAEEAESEEDEEHADEAESPEEAEESAGGSSSSRRRRRRRRRSGDGADAEPGHADDPERTVVKVREPRKKEEGTSADEVQSIKGSTRLEAKKQRRREGREQGRRRVPIITEAEFLARREAVERVMVVRQSGERTQIGVLEDNVLVEHFVNKEQATSYVGNVYLGKVQNVLPSMEAAFVDIGKGRNAVLYAGEVNFEALGMANGPRRIETALKSGQSVLVQVTKDPIGHKGARLTSQVSLPGRYLVYVPEGSMTGISRKLPDTERSRLKQILKKIVPEDAGVIVRTAAEGASEDELARDVQRLQAQWEEIQKKAKGSSANAPTLLYGEPDMTVRVVRDIFNEDFSKVIVSGDEAWETIHGYVNHVAPDLVDRLQKWTSDVDVFATYRIDEQLMKALDRKVWLPSGGSLVIDRTEAMVVVDVNTGKFTGQGGNLEETVTRNNLEAAEEIVRQLRLRDLGGIIVIDFIDMVLESNRDLVLRRLLECLGRDRTKHQVAEVTSLGLVQMTRKRVGQGLLESFSEQCVHCNGRGVIVHMEQPTTIGGGGKRKKKGKAAQAEPHVHEVEAAPSLPDGAAPELEPAPVTEAELQPAVAEADEWFSSPAEAEAAAGRSRGRRRVSRKVSAPAGAPKAAEEPAAIVVPAEPAPAAEPQPVAEAAPEAPVAEPAPARPRRRVTRKVTAPAGSPEADESAATVVISAPAAEPVAEPVSGEAAEPVGAEAAEAEAAPAAKKTAKKAAAKKATAKKTAAKKAPAKKAAAKKTTTAKKATAKKTATKKATTKKAAAKKTAAAEQS